MLTACDWGRAKDASSARKSRCAIPGSLLNLTCWRWSALHYKDDHTEDPACALAAGAATIYRNYFAPVGNGHGQTIERQLDMLAEVGEALSGALNKQVSDLWQMQNGYALCTREGLGFIANYITGLDAEQTAVLSGNLCIGLHWDVEATGAAGENRPLVSQAFCSALPVAYSTVELEHWKKFACFILDAAYEIDDARHQFPLVTATTARPIWRPWPEP
jgi:hypothetical protein